MRKDRKITAVILGGGMLLRLMFPCACENPLLYTVRAGVDAALAGERMEDTSEDGIRSVPREVTPSEPVDGRFGHVPEEETSVLCGGANGLSELGIARLPAGESDGPKEAGLSVEEDGRPEDATPSTPDIGKEPPRLLSLTGSGYSSLEAMSPVFSPDIHVYHFLDNRPYYHMDREMHAVVEPDVQVQVNGDEISVGADGSCVLFIPYRAEDSANTVMLTNRLTGLSSTYTFHTYGYSINDPLGRLSLVNAAGEEDPANIGSFERQGNATVYYGSTNLARVRLKWSVGILANNEYRADVVDSRGNRTDTILAVAGEEGGSQEITSKVINLDMGENTFYIKCHGKYQQWVNGKPVEREGVHVTAVIIFRNEAVQDENFTDTTVEDLQIYINDINGKKYIANFDPSRRTYKLQLPYQEFDRALGKNSIYLKVGCKNEKQTLYVTGGSTLAGVSTSLRLQDNGCYQLAQYNVRELYSSDSFTAYVTVTAADNISHRTYTLRIVKEGQAGMYVPSIYYEKVFGIGPSRPERQVLLTLGSVYFFNELGQRTSITAAKKKGYFHIEISDTSVITYDDSSVYDFPIRIKKPGKVSVQLIYDDKKHHFEDTIYVYTYYSTGYLRTELTIAGELLEETQKSDRIYAEGAKEAFEKEIASAQAVYDDLAKVKDPGEAQRNRLTAAAEALMAAEETYKLSEIGKKITAFEPLPAYIASQTVRGNTTVRDVRQPDTVTAVIDGEKTEIKGVTWKARPEWERRPYEEVRYYFTAVLPPGYVAMEGVKYPQIFVLRQEEGVPIIVKSTIPLGNYVLYQHLPVGSAKEQIYLPDLQMSAREGTGMEYGLITVPVLWDDLDGFDGDTPGIYRFRSRLDPAYPDFQFQPNSTRDPMQVITVIIDPLVEDEPERPSEGGAPGGDGSGDGFGGDTPGGNGSGGSSGGNSGDSSGGGNSGDSSGGGGFGGDTLGGNGSEGSSGGDASEGNSPGDGSGRGSPGSLPGTGTGGQDFGNSQNSGFPGGGDPGHIETAETISSLSGAPASGKKKAEGNPSRRREAVAAKTASEEKTADKKAAKDSSQKTADTENGREEADGPAVKKKKWKVTQVLGDIPESEGGGGLLARMLALVLLLYGGVNEYLGQNKRKRREK